ncbi:MAG: SGNH/GDSL hydrolase family protein [Thermoanaerobaculia bacterium]
MGSRISRVAGNVALSVAAALLCAAGAEMALRLLAWREPSPAGQDLARTLERQPPPFRGDCSRPEDQAALGDVVRPSSLPDLIYELRPDLDTCFYGARVRTDAAGVRTDRALVRPKPPDVYRIVLLGDSQAFGQGVELSDTFGELVAADLARRSGRTVEVVNLGVDGYNTVQEAATLRHKGLAYEPDCVTVLFVGNDLELPAFLQAPRPDRAVDPRRSFLLEGLASLRRALSRRTRSDPFEPLTAPDPSSVPEEYRHMVGVDAYRRALASMARMVRPLGIPLVNLAGYSVQDKGPWYRLRRWQEDDLGIVVPVFRLPYAEEFWLSDANRHLNPHGHRVAADMILAAFEDSGVCLPSPVSGPAAPTARSRVP